MEGPMAGERVWECANGETLPIWEWKQLLEKMGASDEEKGDAILINLASVFERFAPTGFVLLECLQFDSSYAGSCVIMPFGGKATWSAPPPPSQLVTPRGLASDTSRSIAVLRPADVPLEEGR